MISDQNRYSANYIKNLFNEMAANYGLVNLIASLGFTVVWRKYCVDRITYSKPNALIIDYMTGMGELFSQFKRFSSLQKIIGVDFSPRMCDFARKNAEKSHLPIEVLEKDALSFHIESASADFVFSSFGLKTFTLDQQTTFAREVKRVLKTGGQFSFIEISMPKNKILKGLFLFYIKFVIPQIGKFFLSNSATYRELAFYTQNFGDCRYFHSVLEGEGLKATYFEHFFGCATGVFGSR